MKRSSLLQHLRRHGCVLKREGAAHSLWTNPATGAVEAIPRHTEIANIRRLASSSTRSFPVRRHDIDLQILLEIGHVLSNIRQLRITTQTSAPGPPVNSAEHNVGRRRDRGGETSGDNDALQFDSIDDQRFANQTEAACFVQKNESRPAGMFDVHDQGKFSNPSRGIAGRAFRETFANVRVQHK
jgi:mRNA interferase HicA